MKIINLDIVNEKLFYEKLDNGLDVYIIKKENKQKKDRIAVFFYAFSLSKKYFWL